MFARRRQQKRGCGISNEGAKDKAEKVEGRATKAACQVKNRVGKRTEAGGMGE